MSEKQTNKQTVKHTDSQTGYLLIFSAAAAAFAAAVDAFAAAAVAVLFVAGVVCESNRWMENLTAINCLYSAFKLPLSYSPLFLSLSHTHTHTHTYTHTHTHTLSLSLSFSLLSPSFLLLCFLSLLTIFFPSSHFFFPSLLHRCPRV